MTGMASIPPEVAEENLMVANVVHDVFSALFPSNSPPRGLDTSRWASQSVVQQTGLKSQGLTDSIWAPKENSKKDPEKVRYFCSLFVSFREYFYIQQSLWLFFSCTNFLFHLGHSDAD